MIGSRTICVTFFSAFLRVGGRLEGEEHAALRVRLPENLAQLVGNQDRLDLGEFQLLGDLGGWEAVLEADHQRRDLVVARIGHFDAREWIDRVQLHQADVEFSRFLGLSPCFFHVVTGASAGVMPWKLVTSISAGPRFFDSGTGISGAPALAFSGFWP